MLKKIDDLTGVEMDLGAGFEVAYRTADGAVFVRHVAEWSDIWSAGDALFPDQDGKEIAHVSVRNVQLAAIEQAPASDRPRAPVPQVTYPRVDADGVRVQ